MLYAHDFKPLDIELDEFCDDVKDGSTTWDSTEKGEKRQKENFWVPLTFLSGSWLKFIYIDVHIYVIDTFKLLDTFIILMTYLYIY
jgi:hypothetical protein